MAFCHIYARKDGRFTVRMRGAVTRAKAGRLPGGFGAYTSQPLDSEATAREWIRLGRERDGLDDMPEPTVIRRGS